MKTPYVLLILLLSSVFSIVNVYVGFFPEIIPFGTEWMNLISGIALGLISAIILYYFINYLPEKEKKSTVKDNFLESYKYFKLDTIQTFLWVIGDDSKLPEDIQGIEEFKELFSDEKWRLLINQIENEENKEHFNDLMFRIDVIHKKINILLLSGSLSNNALKFFHRLDESLYRIKYLKKDSERYQNEYKLFWRTLWSIYTSYSFVNGYPDEDEIKSQLDSD